MANFTLYDQYGDQTIRSINDCVTLTKSSVTCSGASGALVAASTNRVLVIITSAPTNGTVAFDPTGGTCALDAGIILDPGNTVQFSGRAAQSAFTQFGTNGNKFTVYVGVL